MSDLSIKLFLDEDVDVLITELMRAHGFVATTRKKQARFMPVTRRS